jgi:hypothetical protein
MNDSGYDEAVDSRLDTICQEMKGGGITLGGVRFSGQEAAMDWAQIHLPPNTYQCIGGMIYAVCLISEAVVHQEDMMKREEHGKRVKRTFMQLAQVLLVHTSYPLVLDRAKAVQQDGKVDFGELKSYKQWKPIDGEGASKKLKEGMERSFDLITNAIDSTFLMKPQAHMVLLDLVSEIMVLFHKLFVMEVNLFYEETLNKVGGNIRLTQAKPSAGRWSPNSSALFPRPCTGRVTSQQRRVGPEWIYSRPTDTFSMRRLKSFGC